MSWAKMGQLKKLKMQLVNAIAAEHRAALRRGCLLAEVKADA